MTVTSGACAGWAEAASSDKVGGVPGGVLECKHGRDESMESLEVSALESTSIGSSTSRAVVGAVLVCKAEVYILQAVPFLYPAANCWVHIYYPKFRFFLAPSAQKFQRLEFF